MAQAVQFTRIGGPEVLELVEVPDPVPAAGEVAIRVEAAGVNPIERKLRTGVRPLAGDGPWRAGSDGAGIVTAVGADVDGLRVGDAVAFFGAHGAYATDVRVDAAHVFLRPAGVSAAQGAALGIPAGTAYQALRSLGIREDDTLLIHGGSGAVGQAAIQFAVLFGAHVIATTSAGRASRVRDLGAEPVVYGDGLTGRVLEAAPDGVTAILDCAGADGVLEASLELLEDTSRIATIVLGQKADELGLRAFAGGSRRPLTPQQNAWRAEAVPVALALIAAGYFDVEIGESFSLDEAGRAQSAGEAGAPGKLLLVP
ncbi:NADP-dependent oxidoreductase [Microbacterium sp. ZXX196]|uniref:quinone oxidoreductase family protein n=1 Tax=Microbacterium sp. ZXX196 TaxID=2609291 RepID=UPI0012B9B813|nr:NADP-dependent oxidoreductase [Microbacterium sp. ZXX196]MTE22788.1 zinc-binding dehydrogenase [Microbacterium sp. ZXX196]